MHGSKYAYYYGHYPNFYIPQFFFSSPTQAFGIFPAFLVFIVLLLLSFIYLCVVRVFSKSPPETSRDNTQMRCLAISEKNVILTTVEREKSTQDIPMSMIFFFKMAHELTWYVGPAWPSMAREEPTEVSNEWFLQQE